jgi:hypothetical protein
MRRHPSVPWLEESATPLATTREYAQSLSLNPIEETLELVGPLPFTIVEGVRATIEWLREEQLI